MKNYLLASLLFLFIPAVAVAQENKAADVIRFWRPNVGQWNTSIETDGKIQKGEWTLRLAKNKMCFIGSGALEGLPDHQMLEGYDPEHACLKRVWFLANGAHWYDMIPVDQFKQRRLQAGVTLKVKTTVVAPDGKPTEFEATWHYTTVTRDKIELTIDNGILGSKSKLTLTRKERKQP